MFVATTGRAWRYTTRATFHIVAGGYKTQEVQAMAGCQLNGTINEQKAPADPGCEYGQPDAPLQLSLV